MTEKMTETERLRALLDERGVKWWEGCDERKTLWESGGLTWEYFNNENGDAWIGFLGACEQDVSPDQAVEATLGRGTCKMKRVEDEQRILHGWLECSECGPVYPPVSDRIAQAVAFCPFCGRKVVE